jgi:hypothetical protein
MTLKVRVFQAHKQDFLAGRHLDTQAPTRCLSSDVAVTRHALPLGLPIEDVILLQMKCSDYIRCMVSEDSDGIFRNVMAEGGCNLAWRAFNSVTRYRRAATHIKAAVSLSRSKRKISVH